MSHNKSQLQFSIIIPTLNEENYIGILLQALTQQTYNDFEVIVVDGNSDDATIDKVLEFKGRIDVRVLQSGIRNQSVQRNIGAQNAKYDHLVFFDADVKPVPEFMEKLANKVRRSNPDSLTAWNIPMSKKLVDKLMFGAYNVFYLEGMKKFQPGATGIFIYCRKEPFLSVSGFDKKITFAEDFDLTKRLHKAGYSFDILRKPGIHFSVRRLDKEGRAGFIKKQFKAGLYYHTKGVQATNEVIKPEFGKF